MDLELLRFAYCPENTQGRLYLADSSWWTIEQPWVRWEYPGGKPFASCVPDGKYSLVPFLRPKGEQSFALINPALGVYFQKNDRPGARQGRYLCLIHAGNWVTDIEGCIVIGDNRMIDPERNEMMVTHSQRAMKVLVNLLGWVPGHTLTIRRTSGAVDTPLAAAGAS